MDDDFEQHLNQEHLKLLAQVELAAQLGTRGWRFRNNRGDFLELPDASGRRSAHIVLGHTVKLCWYENGDTVGEQTFELVGDAAFNRTMKAQVLEAAATMRAWAAPEPIQINTRWVAGPAVADHTVLGTLAQPGMVVTVVEVDAGEVRFRFDGYVAVQQGGHEMKLPEARFRELFFPDRRRAGR